MKAPQLHSLLLCVPGQGGLAAVGASSIKRFLGPGSTWGRRRDRSHKWQGLPGGGPSVPLASPHPHCPTAPTSLSPTTEETYSGTMKGDPWLWQRLDWMNSVGQDPLNQGLVDASATPPYWNDREHEDPLPLTQISSRHAPLGPETATRSPRSLGKSWRDRDTGLRQRAPTPTCEAGAPGERGAVPDPPGV